MLFVLPAATAFADDAHHDYLVFLDAGEFYRSGMPADYEIKRNEGEATATLVYSWQNDRLRFFTEVHGADAGRVELARLQLGWRLEPKTTAWIGRFHNPQGYWNTQYHHDAYVQTPIRRPGIEEFDDEGGVLVSHYVGAQLDGTRSIGRDAGLRYEVGFGLGGELDQDGLESPLLIGPRHEAKSTASLRLTYNPQEGGPDAFGLFIGWNRIPAKDLNFRELRQAVSGAFVNKAEDRLRLVGAVFFVRNELDGGAMPDTAGGFANAYLQGEYQINESWTPYLRAEGSRGVDNDPYLAMFPRFVKDRALAGLRFDFGRKQAVKLEYGRSRIEAGRYNELGIQWSMAFP